MNIIIYHTWDYIDQHEHDDAADALRYAARFITLDKTKSKPWIRPSDRYAMFPNVYELAEKKGFENLMKLVDWDTHNNPYLECLLHDTHRQPFYDGNHNTREKEKTMKTIKDVDRIVITKNDLNEVLLRAYSGNEIVKKTIAKCSPDDIFDFNIGAKLSVDRLYDGYDMTPKPKRKPFNGKILIRYTVEGNTYNRICTITKGFGSFTFQTKSGRNYVLNTNSLYEDSFEIGGDIVDLIKAFNESRTALAHNAQINCVLRIDD